MKMKFLLALMAGTIALSAQAEFQKCNGNGCELLKKGTMDFIKNNGNEIFETPNGKKIPLSVLKNAKLEAYHDDEKDVVLIHSPNANCQQLWVLTKLHIFSQDAKKQDNTPGLEFFSGKLVEKKCGKSLGLE